MAIFFEVIHINIRLVQIGRVIVACIGSIWLYPIPYGFERVGYENHAAL